MKKLVIYFGIGSIVVGVLLLFVIPGYLLRLAVNKITSVDLPSPLYVLVIGRDEVIQRTTRSDVIMIAALDIEKGKVVLTNVPRDLLHNGKKMNYYFAEGGVPLLSKAISNLCGIPVDYYLVVDYRTFKYLGDALGPIEVVVKTPMKYYDKAQNLNIDFSPGVYKLNGPQLLAYIRYRKGGLGDLDRIRREKEVVLEFMKRIKYVDMKTLLDIAGYLKKNIETNFDMYQLVYLALRFRKNFKLSFATFPTKLLDNGNLIVDQHKLKTFIKELRTLSISSENQIPRILLVNGKKSKTKVFQPIEEARWKKIAGFTPVEYLWEDIGLSYHGSVAFITTKKSSIYNKIRSLLVKLYPHRKFIFLWSAYSQDIRDYYKLVIAMAKNRKYLDYPIDAVVILGEIDEK